MDAWLTLFRAAVQVMDAAGEHGPADEWTVGGGTMLWRRYRHRRSKDIDVFLTHPQHLAALSPRLNAATERLLDARSGSYAEQSNFLKLTLPEGDVDFVVAPHLLTPFAMPDHIDGRAVMVETPAEILAKKVLYRAADFTARDLFDLAFLIENGEAVKLMAHRSVYLPKLRLIVQRLRTNAAPLRRSFAAIEAEDYTAGFDRCVEAVAGFVAENGG